jgi:hypothetical protein
MISGIGMMLEVGARTMKNQKIEKEINLFCLMRPVAKIKRKRMMEIDTKVGYSKRDFEIWKS